VQPLIYDLDLLRKSLAPEVVTIKTMPPDLARDWVSPDGRAREFAGDIGKQVAMGCVTC
jgi:hypothetical protein